MKGGRTLGIIVIVATIFIVFFSVQYNQRLELQREQAIAQLISTPAYAKCQYDASTCPQAQNNIAVPDATGIGLVVLSLLVGAYRCAAT